MRLLVKDIGKQKVYIGFLGEQNYAEIAFDFSNIFSEYPEADVTLRIKPPDGEAYPHSLTREENIVVWHVNASDCSSAGMGSYQVTFTSGNTIIKSFVGLYVVRESIDVTGDPPDPYVTWLTELEEAAANVHQEIGAAEETMSEYLSDSQDARDSAIAAKEAAETASTTAQGAAQTATGKAFDATEAARTATSKANEANTSAMLAENYKTTAVSAASQATSAANTATQSATIATTKAYEAAQAVEDVDEAVQTALQEAKDSGEFDGEKGDKGDKGNPGEPGEDGISPVVSVSTITGGHRIAITDADGTKTFDVMDGENGDDGFSPQITVTNITGGHRVSVTDASGTNTFDVMDGQDGQDGVTPDFSIGTVQTLPGPTACIPAIVNSGLPCDRFCFERTGDQTLDQIESDITDLKLNKADIIVSSASGAIASFPDGAESTAKELVVGIEPVQDLHGQDAPYPPGGGKNKFDIDKLVNTADITVSNGVITVNGNARNSGKKLSELADLNVGETYILSFVTTSENFIYLYGTDANVSWRSGNQMTMTQDLLDAIVFFYGGANTTGQISNLMIRLSSISDATYSPYSNICPISGWTGANVYHSGADMSDPETISISFPSSAGTVYGGNLTVYEDGSGKLVVDRGETVFDGTQTVGLANWRPNEASVGWLYNKNVTPGIITIMSSSVKPNIISDRFKTVQYGGNDGVYGETVDCISIVSGNQIWGIAIRSTDTSLTTAEAINAWLSDNPVTVVYELATPIEYTLTDVEVLELLKGVNNVWASTGNTSVTYRADTKLFIEKKISELQALILENL